MDGVDKHALVEVQLYREREAAKRQVTRPTHSFELEAEEDPTYI